MNTSNKNQVNRKQNPPQANAELARLKAKTIKLGIDVHLDRYVALRLIDGGTHEKVDGFPKQKHDKRRAGC